LPIQRDDTLSQSSVSTVSSVADSPELPGGKSFPKDSSSARPAVALPPPVNAFSNDSHDWLVHPFRSQASANPFFPSIAAVTPPRERKPSDDHLYLVHYLVDQIPTDRTKGAFRSSGIDWRASDLDQRNIARLSSDDQRREKTRTAEVGSCELIEMTDYTYVQLAKTKSSTTHHEYAYPSIGGDAATQRNVTSSTKGVDPLPVRTTTKRANIELPPIPFSPQTPPLLPAKPRSKRRDWLSRRSSPSSRRLVGGSGGSLKQRCRYCHETYSHDENMRGSCVDAPDECGACIERVSCLCCARAFFYHCMADVDSESNDADSISGRNPCSVGGGGAGRAERRTWRRWTALAVLSLLVPCLCCYLPLHSCHRCAMRGGACCYNGRHKSS